MAYILSFIMVNDPEQGFIVLGHANYDPWKDKTDMRSCNPNSHKNIRESNGISHLLSFGNYKNLPIVMIEVTPVPVGDIEHGGRPTDDVYLNTDPNTWLVYPNLDERELPPWWIDNAPKLEQLVRDKVREVMTGQYKPIKYIPSVTLTPKLLYTSDSYFGMLAINPEAFPLLKLPIHETIVVSWEKHYVCLYNRSQNKHYTIGNLKNNDQGIIDPWDLAKLAKGKWPAPKTRPIPPRYHKVVPPPLTNTVIYST